MPNFGTDAFVDPRDRVITAGQIVEQISKGVDIGTIQNRVNARLREGWTITEDARYQLDIHR